MDPHTGAPLSSYDPSGADACSTQLGLGANRRASAEGFRQYQCANDGEAHTTTAAPWVGRVLNRLYVSRNDPRTSEEQAQLSLHRERQLLRSNPIRNQLDVYRDANRATHAHG